MATVYPQAFANVHTQSLRHHTAQLNPPQRRPQTSKQRFVAELSQCLYDFVVQLLPTAEELVVKEDVRKLLERLIRSIEPESRLLSFGSTANGFSLRNSDMDLCCLIDSEDRLAASDLVTMVGDLLARETKFAIKPLPHARIPIVKLSLPPSPGLPFGIACDIGFENRLALENTRLLWCYARINPARVRTMVLFLKVWCKRRKINSPYKGTLSSYGYVLLVIYFLVHVKNPPVLPNLQQLPPLRPISPDETHLNGHNIWFFDDIDLLRERWKSSNTETVAELLIDFFKFYSRDFTYNTCVVSIRAGLLTKEIKGWQSEVDMGTARERNRLCIEDPFETEFNVARCVTRDGLYTIRGEFMRASRILATRPDRAIVALAQLCEERKDEELLHASPSRAGFVPPRLSSVPPETPYNIHSSPMRPSGVRLPEHLSPQETHIVPAHARGPVEVPAERLEPPEHMAPRRSKWTSPPPPEAPEEEHSAFDTRLGVGLALATSSVKAREVEHDTASSNNSEVHTDDEDIRSLAESDDVHSIRSFVEVGTTFYGRYDTGTSPSAPQSPQTKAYSYSRDPSSSRAPPRMASSHTESGTDPKWFARLRGRSSMKQGQYVSDTGVPLTFNPKARNDTFTPPPRMETPRRSMSGPARAVNMNRFSMSALPTVVSPVSAYPTRHFVQQPQSPHANVFYETAPLRERMARALGSAYAMPVPVARAPSFGVRTENMAYQYATVRAVPIYGDGQLEVIGPTPPMSTTPSQTNMQNHGRARSHRHSQSQATVTAPTPPPASTTFPTKVNDRSASRSRSRSASRSGLKDAPSRSPLPAYHESKQQNTEYQCGSPSVSASSTSVSPPNSSPSSQYISPLSTSPPSPMQGEALNKHGLKLPSPIPEKEHSHPLPPTASKVDLAPDAEQRRIAIVDSESEDALTAVAENLKICG